MAFFNQTFQTVYQGVGSEQRFLTQLHIGHLLRIFCAEECCHQVDGLQQSVKERDTSRHFARRKELCKDVIHLQF